MGYNEYLKIYNLNDNKDNFISYLLMEKKDIKEKLLNAYIEYKKLKRELDVNVGNDLEKAYNYIGNLTKTNGKITFTNVNLEVGYFDFFYGDMILTIDIFNDNKIAELSTSMEIYISEVDEICIDYFDLEKHVEKFIKGEVIK